MTSTRQLAAIMFTDIVGYTALMGKDSNKAMELVRQSIQIQKPLVEKHNGKWLKEMGDGAMAQFGSALDAVNCALEIQRTSRADFDANLRIGIHLGDITIENNDVYGDGVNVAARLESIADPGGIYISESIEKAIRGQGNIQAKYIGESQLKNVDYGVRTYALQGVGLPVPDLKKDKELSGHLFAEIKRRGVARAGIMYILISTLLMLLLPFVQSWLNIPELSSTKLIIILGIGFAIAMYLAWRFERSPEGFVRSNSKQSWRNPLSVNKRKPLTGNIIMGSLVIIILFLFFYPSGTSETKMTGILPDDTVIDKSIAILPFANMSDDPEQEYFSDGMSEEIINKLAQIEDLRVIARTSAFAFKGKDEDMREIGRKLDVAHLLEGSVRKAGNRIRITAQLINVSDGSHLWSQSYDREMGDAAAIFDIQDEISLAIVDQLKVNLLGKEKAELVKRYTDDLEAYDLYLKGSKYLNHRSIDEFNKASEYFEESLQNDPNYAPAYVGLAWVYVMRSFWGDVPPNEAYPKAKEYVKKALELDNTLALAHCASALINMFYDWEFKAAEQKLKLAIHLNPNSPGVHDIYTLYLTLIGQHEEAITEAKLALKFDPLSSYFNFRLGETYLVAQQFDSAIDQLQKTISIDPKYFYPHLSLGHAYSGLSMLKEVIEQYEQAVELSGGNPQTVSSLSSAYYLNGELDKAAQLNHNLELRSKQEYIPSSTFIWYNLHRGDKDQVYLWIERAIDERDGFIPFYVNSFEKNPMLNEPRFKALLKKVGL